MQITYQKVRNYSLKLCEPLETEDYIVQPMADVSPPKWHLGHTTWFFETFVLQPYLSNYNVFNSQYNFVFNSYYETVGARIIRTDRGNLSRPTVHDVLQYRAYVDKHMQMLFNTTPIDKDLTDLITLGLQHEQQHQELLLTDIKYILGHNPLFPVYNKTPLSQQKERTKNYNINVNQGLYTIGYAGEGFSFDNEGAQHQVFLEDYEISMHTVTNGDYLAFIESDGYANFNFWHAEGWNWVKKNDIQAPLYWHFIDNQWQYFTLHGLCPINLNEAVSHVSFYEAAAFANWKEMRLPTEAEWEIASDSMIWGDRWEWTNSAYLSYPGFQKAPGAIGEYNGKFMVNQMVLRGASIGTPKGHSRKTYRNFFYPHQRWQFTGIRLVK
ncbi:ergothioneine biosynthesis protein EgtB [Galbibacter sp. BG1]